MIKNKKLMAAVLTAALALSSVTVFAQSTAAQAQQGTETILEDNRTLTEKGNANLVDNVSDSEDLQFITVTSKEGDTFYFIIDKAADSDNVYFLNKVDDSDLAALAEDGEITKAGTTVTEPEPEKPETSPEPEPEKETETKEPEHQTKKSDSNGFLIMLLIIVAVAGGAGYYFKILLPKKKLEQADDFDDYEFVDEDKDETVNEDSDYEDDDTEDEE